MNEVIGKLCPPPPLPPPHPYSHPYTAWIRISSCFEKLPFFLFFFFSLPRFIGWAPPPSPPPQTFKNDDTNERIVNLNSYTCKIDYSWIWNCLKIWKLRMHAYIGFEFRCKSRVKNKLHLFYVYCSLWWCNR